MTPTAPNTGARFLVALRVTDPEKWQARIRGALVAARGNVAEAARALGVTPRSLWRWIGEDPSLLKGTEHTFHPGNPGGRPRKQTKNKSS